MNIWKMIVEGIGRTGALVMIAIAGTFYVSFTFIFPILEFKTDFNDSFFNIDSRFDAIHARLDEREKLLKMMIKRMEERPLNPELWKNYDLNDTTRQ